MGGIPLGTRLHSSGSLVPVEPSQPMDLSNCLALKLALAQNHQVNPSQPMDLGDGRPCPGLVAPVTAIFCNASLRFATEGYPQGEVAL